MSDRKKEYDRQRAKKLYEEYKKKRTELLIKFGSKCFVCEEREGDLHFHHLEYGEYGKYGHASMWRRIQHNKEIEEFPERFKLLCNSCHSIVTILTKRKDLLQKLIPLIP